MSRRFILLNHKKFVNRTKKLLDKMRFINTFIDTENEKIETPKEASLPTFDLINGKIKWNDVD